MHKFGGWYFKIEDDEKSVAFIVGKSEITGANSAFIQIITKDGAVNIPFDGKDYIFSKKQFKLALKNNTFDESGIKLDIENADISIHAAMKFGAFTRPGYDIMGPFRFLPALECRHTVVSLMHKVEGKLMLNGKELFFKAARGYIEGDSGRSFPSEYAWSQCFFPGGSLMISVAKVPIMGLFRITGVIGIIQLKDRQYRIGTYLGAKVKRIRKGEIIVKQGKSTFRAVLTPGRHTLAAPDNGKMSRLIRESVRCKSEYSYIKKGETILDFKSDSASSEYEYNR